MFGGIMPQPRRYWKNFDQGVNDQRFPETSERLIYRDDIPGQTLELLVLICLCSTAGVDREAGSTVKLRGFFLVLTRRN